MTTILRTTPTEAGGFGYTIRRASTGWAWSAYDLAGRCVTSGIANTRAIAAASIIQALASDAAGAQAAPLRRRVA